MKLIINERQMLLLKHYVKKDNFTEAYFNRNLLLKEEWGKSFDIKTLNTIPTFHGRNQYCETFLKKIGEGSSRIVYDIGNGFVIKLAKDEKGLAQCEGEVLSYNENNPLLAKIPYFNKVKGYYLYIVMEHVKQATVSDFKSILGVNFHEVMEEAENFAIDSSDRKNDHRNQHKYFIKYLKGYSKAMNNEKVGELSTHIESYLIDNDIVTFGDIVEPENWGVSGGQLKLIDFGLNDEVFLKHYADM